MERYENRGGNSGVRAFEIGQDSVSIQFNDGWLYTYTDQSCGPRNIAILTDLAHGGQGLNTFIVQHVRKLYASKKRLPR